MPYNKKLVPWRLIPIDIPPAKNRWRKFLKKLYENGGNLQEPSGGSSQSTEGSPTPERILKKNIMPNGAENITVVVLNKGNTSNNNVKTSEREREKKEKTRRVRRTSNEVQIPDSTSSTSRPSHSLDNLPSSYQRSNLTDRHDRTWSYDRPSSHDRLSAHDRSGYSRKERRYDDRANRSESSKSRHSESVNPPLRPWFRSHDMVEDYGRHRTPEELPQQYRSAFAAKIRVSLDSNSPRKVYDDSYHGPTRHRRHSDEPKRTKTPYSRPHNSQTPSQDRLNKLEKQLKEGRERKLSMEYGDREASGSDVESKPRKTPPDGVSDRQENGGASELDEEAMEGVWQVKADERDIRRNGMRIEDMLYSPVSEKSPNAYDRYSSKYDKKTEERPSDNCRISPSPDSKCSTDSIKSRSDYRGSTSKDSLYEQSYQNNPYKQKLGDGSHGEPPVENKLKHIMDSLKPQRQRSASPEMMDWQPINSDIINTEIEELRKNETVAYSSETSIKSFISALNPNNYPKENNIFIVVDTNVMCTDLVKNLLSISLAGIDLVFYVPWKVLCELDTLKSSNRSIARRAQRACSLMSSKCNDSSSRLRAQPPFMHGKVIDGFKPETSDDYILLSALQLKIEGHSVVLLTNDKNLMAKAEAAGVKKFSEGDLDKIVNMKNMKSDPVPLEETPPESVKSSESLMAHQLAIAFKNFLIKCLDTLKESQGNFWVFYVATLPPWSLLDAVKTIRSSWNFLCPELTESYKQLSLLNSIQFFLKDTSYDNLNMDKLHTLLDECCTFATSLPNNFTEVANGFISQAKEILEEQMQGSEGSHVTPKLTESDELDDISDEERAANIIDQLDVFSQKLLSFCGYVYRLKGIEWPMGESNPGETYKFTEEFIIKYTPFAVSTLETIISSLTRLCTVEMGRVESETNGVEAIHKCLSDFNGDPYKYSVRDVAAFANNPQVRANMNRGIVELRKLADILNKIV